MSVADQKNNNDDAKAQAAVIEDVKTPLPDRMPEILISYSTAELQAMEKSLVRKIDLRSLPILIVLFILNILDRNAIANARLGGLEETLKIDDVQYQTAVMVLWGKSALIWAAAYTFNVAHLLTNN